ncbi:MAG: methionyl-tRNA formyltransferase [Chthoniobacterales bacterium]
MRVVFIGTGEIGLPVLHSLGKSAAHQLVGVVTQPDKPVGRDQRIKSPPIKAALAGSALPILQPKRIRDSEAITQIRELRPDVIVVMAYGQILPRAVLEIPAIACLNLHASLLPKHRGAAPIQAAILAGDHESGITVMYMDEGLDTGDLLLARRLAIAPNETGGSLQDRLAEIAPEALTAALDALQSGSPPRTPQENATVTYAPKLERDHGRIEWADSAEMIERKIRAFNPWPGSYAVLRDEGGVEVKLKIFAATLADVSAKLGELLVRENSVIIGAREGGLRLDEVQLEGKKRMPAADLLRGHEWLRTATIARAARA